jgi:citrate lyase beta subunit
MALSRAQLADPNCKVTDGDYDAILSAIMETARGRWFLSEYARRNRRADTDAVLSALNDMREALGFNRRASRPYLIKTAFSSSSDASQQQVAPAAFSYQSIPHLKETAIQASAATAVSRTPHSDIATNVNENRAFQFNW